MNARIVFVFGLVFTAVNIVVAFTTHAGLFMMAIIGLMVVMGAASKIWPDVVRPSHSEPSDAENIYGYHDADISRTE